MASAFLPTTSSSSGSPIPPRGGEGGIDLRDEVSSSPSRVRPKGGSRVKQKREGTAR